jgi:hypothetical protein
MTLSRDQAAEIALAEALRLHLGFRVARIVAASDLGAGLPSLYTASLDDCYVAYIEQTGTAIRSSVLVAVHNITGTVVYAGSAFDEG